MDIFTSIIVPVLVATVPGLLAFFGTKAQIKADMQKDLEERKQAREEQEKRQQVLQDELIETIYNRTDALEKGNENLVEGLKCLLRTSILNIYYEHCDEEEPSLPQWEAENYHTLRDTYFALKGNSFIKDVCKVMDSWKINKH